jgi:hypothetical protein
LIGPAEASTNVAAKKCSQALFMRNDPRKAERRPLAVSFASSNANTTSGEPS